MISKMSISTNPNIQDLLEWGRKITSHFQEQMGKWSLKEQINEVFTEVAELNQLIRHGKLEISKDDFIEELWDIIFSALTLAHVTPIEISDEDLLRGLLRVQLKLEERVKNNYYSRDF